MIFCTEGHWIPIQSALFWIFSMLSMTWVWACPHSCQLYQRWNSKIAEYIVFKSFESTWYLILAKRLFVLLSLSFIVSVCCLNVRCWCNFKPKYLASLTIFIFCPLILKFICFLISIFLFWRGLFLFYWCLMKFCLLWASELCFWDRNLSFCWCLWGTCLSRANLYHQQSDECQSNW